MADEQRIPFALPDITETEIAAVVDALRSGWITTGPRACEFEAAFGATVGAPHALAVNSATSGLHLALEECGVRAGDAVIVPTVTFAASAEVVRYLGAHPVLADVDPSTGLGTPESFREAAGRADARGWPVRAIMPVHLGGQPCDMDGMLALADQLECKVVEDAAHAFPTTYRGQPIGSIGDVTVFSFYATKTLATGEGGMVTTGDADLAARMRIMRLHGMDRDAWSRYNSDRPAWYYEIVAPGYKYNMTDVAAAIGLEQLKRSESMWERRSHIASRYQAELPALGLEPLALASGTDRHAWHLFVVSVTERVRSDRDGFIDLMAKAGIGTSVHFIPLHRMPYYRDAYSWEASEFPGAESYFRTCVSLPIYSAMTDRQVDRVIEAAAASSSL